MKYEQNISEVSQLQPDYMGFIFHPASPRYFNRVIPELSGTIKRTGVFVDAGLQMIQDQCTNYCLQAVQLHGQESPEVCAILKEKGLEVIKVFSVGESFDFRKIEPYLEVIDYFLFDTKGEAPGGNGITFNWNILESYSFEKPFFLSGGLGPSELERIITLHESWTQKGKGHLVAGVDLNSRFESAPGMKKTKELKAFMQEFNKAIAVKQGK